MWSLFQCFVYLCLPFFYCFLLCHFYFTGLLCHFGIPFFFAAYFCCLILLQIFLCCLTSFYEPREIFFFFLQLPFFLSFLIYYYFRVSWPVLLKKKRLCMGGSACGFRQLSFEKVLLYLAVLGHFIWSASICHDHGY